MPELPNGISDRQRLTLIILGSLAVGVAIVLALVSNRGGSGDFSSTSTSLFGSTTTSTSPTSSTSSTSLTSTSTSVTTSTTVPPTTTTAATTTTAPDPFELIVLEPTGLDEVDFGTGIDSALATMRRLLGQADSDTGWISAEGSGCPGSQIRVVRWESLQMYFTNGETDWGDEGERHFFTYIQSAPGGAGEILPLHTAEDIEVGSTVQQLSNAYGDDLEIAEDEIFGPVWLVDFPGAAILSGSLTSVQPSGQVLSIQGGVGCGE